MIFDPAEDENKMMPLGAMPSMEPMTKQASTINLRSYLEDLYKQKNLGDSDRMKLEQSVAESKPGRGLTFLASLGAGLAGQDQGRAVDALRQGSRDKQKELDSFDAKRAGVFDELKKDREIGKFERDNKEDLESDDPESEKSRLMQTVAARLMPGRDFSKASARQLSTVMPQLKSVFDQELDSARRKEDLAYKQQTRKDDMSIKEKELAFKKQEAEIKRENPKLEGLRTLDKEFAKDYNEWTSGGKESAAIEIDKLKNVAKNLADKKVTTGGLTGAFPDRMTSTGVLQARADVNSTIMSSLRAILGSAFTEKEGERVIKSTWNEADSTDANLGRINRLIENLEGQSKAKEAKSTWFNEHGTLSTYNAQSGSQPKQMSDEDKQALDWAKSNPNDPRSAEIIKRLGM